jgi:hypothetical protein
MNDKLNSDYKTWCMRADMADCFNELGLEKLAKKVMKTPAKIRIFRKYVSILRSIAEQRNEWSVLNILYSSGLIQSYGEPR